MPNNNIRKKLYSIFEKNRSVTTLKRDPSWVDFESWHWLTGKLTTDDGEFFVVKATIYPAGKIIIPDNPLWDAQIHSSRQNLSRIKQSRRARAIIKKYKLDTIRVPRCWVYPISGNNDDLERDNLTDNQVIIVEEFIDAPKDTIWCKLLKDKIQATTIRLDSKKFNQLISLALRGKFPDLHPKNFMIDYHSKIAIIDLEDLLAFEREQIKKAHRFLQPLLQFKLFCREWREAFEGVGITGKTQQANVTARV